MLTGKQRAYLRSLGNELEPIIQIGKNGLDANVITQVDEALEARELIKGKLLQNSDEDVNDLSEELSKKVKADVVQKIGRSFILYRRSSKKPIIELP